MLDEQKAMTASIPAYPVEDGFPVSDTIILNPLSIQMNLYISNTPVTWLYRHGSGTDRVNRICERLENMWLDKELVKVVTTDAIYTNMGITSITIKKSAEIGYAREVALSMQKVRVTEIRTVLIPSYALKSGETEANAGSASTSTVSSSSSATGSAGGSTGSTGSSGGSGSSYNSAKKSKSVLYGVAEGLGFL